MEDLPSEDKIVEDSTSSLAEDSKMPGKLKNIVKY